MRIQSERDLGLQIRDRRNRLGWSQADLAGRIGASRRWVVEVEQGKPRAELGLVLRALAALGLSLNLREAVPAPVAPGAIPLPRYVPPVSVDALLERARDPAAPSSRPGTLSFTWAPRPGAGGGRDGGADA